MFVVMAERHRQIHHRSLAVRFRHDADVIPLYRLHEALCYAVALRTTHSCRAGFQAQHPGERPRFMCPVGRTIVRQPFQWLCWQLPSEAFFYRTQHDILHGFFVIATCACGPVDDLPVTTILREGYPQLFAIIAAELKAV